MAMDGDCRRVYSAGPDLGVHLPLGASKPRPNLGSRPRVPDRHCRRVLRIVHPQGDSRAVLFKPGTAALRILPGPRPKVRLNQRVTPVSTVVAGILSFMG